MRGPYGNYPRESGGDILNAMCEIERLPLNRVELAQLGENQTILYHGRVVGYYRYFDGIEQPLFRWSGEFHTDYSRQVIRVDEKGNQYPDFRLTLTVHDMPGFEIHGKDASPELHKFICYPMLTNYMDHPCYELTKAAGAFFQGGYDREDGEWILIEFWKPAGAQAWVDYLNKNYRPSKTILAEE